MISAVDLTKRFGPLVAVDGASFEVGEGEIVGFIGPNGAGKTTTMRLLTGFLPASGGRAVVAGHDVFENPMGVRRAIGYLPETPPLYPELTIGDYLRFVSEIRELPRREISRRVGEVMEGVGLAGWERRILGSLSKGYRQRVGLAQAILHDPKVLILDEPTSGLDPAQVVGVRDFIRELAADRTVILSTHILSEVERICDRAILIAGGRIQADDTLAGLRDRVGGVRFRVELAMADVVAGARALGALDEVEQVTPCPDEDVLGHAAFDLRAGADPRTAVAKLATAEGWGIRAMERHQPTLEDVFLQVVGEVQP